MVPQHTGNSVSSWPSELISGHRHSWEDPHHILEVKSVRRHTCDKTALLVRAFVYWGAVETWNLKAQSRNSACAPTANLLELTSWVTLSKALNFSGLSISLYLKYKALDHWTRWSLNCCPLTTQLFCSSLTFSSLYQSVTWAELWPSQSHLPAWKRQGSSVQAGVSI